MPEKTQQTFQPELNELNRRVRMMEVRLERLQERVFSIEKSLQELETKFKLLKDTIDKKISDVRNELSLTIEKIEGINKRIEQLATKVEVEKIKTLLSVFNPLTSTFVSREELESKIEELKKSILK
jgi:chromosome segregation ATPase